MRNVTPDRAFRLKKQSIYELNFSEEFHSPKIHTRNIVTQPQESLFHAYTKNRVIKLRESHHTHSRMQSLKQKLIRIFKHSQHQSPNNLFTDTSGKKVLEELKESHSINLQGLQKMVQANEKSPFFLNQPKHSSILRKCYYKFPTDGMERIERSAVITPQTGLRKFTPLLKPRARKSEQWNELNAWNTKNDDSTINLY